MNSVRHLLNELGRQVLDLLHGRGRQDALLHVSAALPQRVWRHH